MSIHRNGQRTPRAALRLLLLALPLSTAAQSRLDPVTITATREPQALSRSHADIVVIDSETIRNSSADSVEDLLRRAAGVQITRNGGPGQTSGYLVRGTGTSSTVVLVDGVRIGSATLGQAELEALSLSQIERIEVLRGPASSLYGADAVGGVIQIFTRRGEGAPRVTGAAAIGGYRSAQGELGISGSHGSFDYAASLAAAAAFTALTLWTASAQPPAPLKGAPGGAPGKGAARPGRAPRDGRGSRAGSSQ